MGQSRKIQSMRLEMIEIVTNLRLGIKCRGLKLILGFLLNQRERQFWVRG